MRKVLLATVASMSALVAAAGTASAQPVKPVAPATIVVHFNGFFQAGLDDVGSTYNNVAGSKISPVTTNGDLRLYPGFDAMTADGLGYGVQVELRDAFFSGGKGVATTSGSTGNGSLYVRRAYGYIGTPDYGYVRIGQTDGGFTLMQTGVGRRIPIILVGSDFWAGLLQWMRARLVGDGMIDAADMDLMQIVDDPARVVDTIFDFYERQGSPQDGGEREQLLYL